MKLFVSRSPEETISIAEQFAAVYLTIGSVVVLRGELGAGKTQFTKGIARAFGIDEHELSSPTFALANEYPARRSDSDTFTFYHLDCYRFEKPEELLELGVEDYLYPKGGITVVEWPERIEAYLPQGRIEVAFEVRSETERQIVITS